MRFTIAFAAALFGAAVAIPAPTTGPSGHEVEIESIAYAGSGCPPGSASSQIDDSKTTMTVMYSGFIAQSGQGVFPTENRKNCNLNIKIKYPAGWQYSILNTDFRGFADLKKGDTGTCKATYWFSGSNLQTSQTLTIKGPYSDNYVLSDAQSLETTIWSPCGQQGMLNINSEVRVSPKPGTAVQNPDLMTVDTSDASFTQLVYFQWQKC